MAIRKSTKKQNQNPATAASASVVKMQVSIAGHAREYGHSEFSLAPGDVVELHPDLAAAWIEVGHAEPSDLEPTVTLTPHVEPIEEPAPIAETQIVIPAAPTA